MKKIIGLAAVAAVLLGTPVYAADSAGTGTLSIIEFRSLPQNNGAPQRLVQRRYEDYRSGRVAAPTLDTQHLR